MERTGRNGEYRRLYETVLSTGSSIHSKQNAIISILKLATIDDSHFSFLLNQIDWFCPSNKDLIPLLNRIIRLYRGTSRSASDGLSIPYINMSVVDVIARTFENTQDRNSCFACLRDNYPHKVCPLETHLTYLNSLLELCRRVPNQRIQFLEIIFQNLASFDTEMLLGEEYINQFITEDQKIMALQEDCTEFELKYDSILANLFNFFSNYTGDQQTLILKEVFIIFQKTVMLIDNTKMVQIAIFYLAELSNQLSNSFVTLLIATILQNYAQIDGSKRKFQSALQYLTSYLCRSKRFSSKKIKKIVVLLLKNLNTNVNSLKTQQFQTITNVKQFRDQNYQHLLILQNIMIILAEFPQIKSEISEQLNSLVILYSQKLHFQHYLHQQILTFHQIAHQKQNNQLVIECTSKFIPVFLPKSSQYISMRLKLTGKRIRRSDMANMKTTKKPYFCSISGNLTPVTIGQNQLEGKL